MHCSSEKYISEGHLHKESDGSKLISSFMHIIHSVSRGPLHVLHVISQAIYIYIYIMY